MDHGDRVWSKYTWYFCTLNGRIVSDILASKRLMKGDVRADGAEFTAYFGNFCRR